MKATCLTFANISSIKRNRCIGRSYLPIPEICRLIAFWEGNAKLILGWQPEMLAKLFSRLMFVLKDIGKYLPVHSDNL